MICCRYVQGTQCRSQCPVTLAAPPSIVSVPFMPGIRCCDILRSRQDGSGGLRLEAGRTDRLWGVLESAAVLQGQEAGRSRNALLLTLRYEREVPRSAVCPGGGGGGVRP